MKKVLFFLLLLVVSLAIIPLFLPKTMHVEKEYVFDAPVNEVYNHFNDLTKFTNFDAWTAQDPNIDISYSSPAVGEDAAYHWKSSNKNLGEGSMTISEAKINEFVRYKELRHEETTGNTTEVIFLKEDDEKTRVIWSFDSGEADYPFQVFNLLMKSTVEDNLQTSLVNLDSIIQKQSSTITDDTMNSINIISQPKRKLFGVLQSTSTDDEEMGTAISETIGLVYSYLHDAQGLSQSQIGEPVVLWKLYDQENDKALFYTGYFISGDIEEVDDFEFTEVAAGKFLTTQHIGPYQNLSKTYSRLFEYGENQNLELSTETYDVYLNLPNETVPADLKTQIFIPIIN